MRLTDGASPHRTPARVTLSGPMTEGEPASRLTARQHGRLRDRHRTCAPLTQTSRFADRHIGPTADEQAKMLAVVGYGIARRPGRRGAAGSDPQRRAARRSRPPARRPRRSPSCASHAARNRVLTSMIGLGWHDTITPPVLRRGILENPGWYTAYTPYQPEISQGRLEMLLNFQTVVSDLTGLPIAGASLLDESTAAAEAMTLCRRISKSTSRRFIVDKEVPPAHARGHAHPRRADRHRARRRRPRRRAARGRVLRRAGRLSGLDRGGPVAHADLVAAAHERGALVAVTTDLLALTLLRPPGEWGADIAVGSAQRFGVPLGFGGPHAGLHGGAVRARARPARAAGRGQRRRRRRAGVPAGAADPRAAHPPREGDQQHLHRAGPAGRDRGGLRGLPRRGRADRRSPSGSTATPPGSPRRCARPGSRSPPRWSSTPSPPGCPAGPTRSSPPRWSGGINLRRVDADNVGVSCDERTTAGARRGRSARPSASPRRRRRGRPELPAELRRTTAVPHPPGVLRAPLARPR